MVPESTSRAAGCPVSELMRLSREAVVGSSRKTSSRSVVCDIAVSMAEVGVVTTSLRRSKAAGPGDSHMLREVDAAGWARLVVEFALAYILRVGEGV